MCCHAGLRSHYIGGMRFAIKELGMSTVATQAATAVLVTLTENT